MGCAGGRTQLGAQHPLAVCPGFRLGDLLAAARAELSLELHWCQWAFVSCLIKSVDMGRESCAPYIAHALRLCHPGLATLCPNPTAAPCPTHVVNELLDHPVPLALVVLRSVLAVLHQANLIGEAQDDSQLLQQVDAVPSKRSFPKRAVSDLRNMTKGSSWARTAQTPLWLSLAPGSARQAVLARGHAGSKLTLHSAAAN